MPLDRITAAFEATYPMWRREQPAMHEANFDADVARETKG